MKVRIELKDYKLLDFIENQTVYNDSLGNKYYEFKGVIHKDKNGNYYLYNSPMEFALELHNNDDWQYINK
jgi:NADH:ubiquinone oxidoreductase subunit